MQSIKNHLIAVLFFTLIISAGFARPVALLNGVKASDWYDPNWTHRKLFTINSGQVDDNLVNFSIYLDLNDFGSDFFANVQTDGEDIVVTASDGITKLSRELVDIDTGNETGELWFKAPSLSGSVDTAFYVYYGNPTGSESNSSDVWSEFENVWHFNDDPSVGISDSTGNLNGVSGGGMSSVDVVNGKLGNGLDFDGVNDRITYSGSSLGTPWTLTFWVYNRGRLSTGAILWNGDDDSIRLEQLSTGRLGYTKYNVADYSSGHTLAEDEWKHVVYTNNGTNLRIFVDGVQVHSVGNLLNLPRTSINFPGSNSYSPNVILDHSRVATSSFSNEWISTEYNNQSSPSAFYSVGSVESNSGSAELSVTGITNNEWDGVSQTEVCFEYFPSAEFAASDAINLSFVPSFSSAVLDATPAEDDADGDTTTDGSFTSLTADGATYTFTDATTQATTNGINLCLDLPAGQSSNSHSISMTDTNGSFGATLLHVADNNDVTVTLEITPTLSFNIRTLDDSADTNVCDLGSIDTTTLPNTDSTDDGAGECGYSLAIGTNATSGFQVQITSDGDLDNASSSIINVTEDQSIAAGTEAYGLINITAAQTGSDGGGNFDQTITEDGDFADDNDYTPVPQTPTNFVSYTDGIDYLAGTDSTDVTQVMHGMTVGSGTPAGLYQQIVTYTTTVTF